MSESYGTTANSRVSPKVSKGYVNSTVKEEIFIAVQNIGTPHSSLNRLPPLRIFPATCVPICIENKLSTLGIVFHDIFVVIADE